MPQDHWLQGFVTRLSAASKVLLEVTVANTAETIINSEELLVSALFWCQSTSGASPFLVSALFWCQHFSGARALLVSALFWCQSASGVSTFLVPAHFWCQHFPGASIGRIVLPLVPNDPFLDHFLVRIA
jgi:hypothetical protein